MTATPRAALKLIACVAQDGGSGGCRELADTGFARKRGLGEAADIAGRQSFALQFLGKDPDSEYNGSPTVWDDGDCYVIQGWSITDPGMLAQIGAVPAHETVLRFPKRMMRFFEEVGNDGAAGL